jgi:hypothetical protein
VTSDPRAQTVYKKTFKVVSSVWVAGLQLPPGKYQAIWTGLNPTVQVQISQGKKVVGSIPAGVVTADQKSKRDQVITGTTSGGLPSLSALQFSGQTYSLKFSENSQHATPDSQLEMQSRSE